MLTFSNLKTMIIIIYLGLPFLIQQKELYENISYVPYIEKKV